MLQKPANDSLMEEETLSHSPLIVQLIITKNSDTFHQLLTFYYMIWKACTLRIRMRRIFYARTMSDEYIILFFYRIDWAVVCSYRTLVRMIVSIKKKPVRIHNVYLFVR